MKRFLITILFLGFIFACTQKSTTANISDVSKIVAFQNVNLIPMNQEIVLKNQTVIIDGERIAGIGSASSTKIPKGAKIVDGTGNYLMPGLSDLHVHIRDESELVSYLFYGVTTVLNMRSSTDTLDLRGAAKTGKIVSPTIFAAGNLVDGDPPIWNNSIVVRNPKEAEQAVMRQKQEGYDFVKVYNRLAKPDYEAIIKTAKEKEIAVVGHIPRTIGAEYVLKSKQAMIAHGEEFFFTYFKGPTDSLNTKKNRPKPDESKIPVIARLTKSAETAVTPNLSFVAATKQQLEDLDAIFSDPEMKYLTESVRQMWKKNNFSNRKDLKEFGEREKIKYPLIQKLTKSFSDTGVLLLLGTDASAPGLFPGKSAHLELKELVKAGLTPFQALSTGTNNAGEFFDKHLRLREPFGTVEVGKRADLILLKRNPLKDINAIGSIRGTMVRGKWFTRIKLRKLRKTFE
ncbi:MAG: amidohydrolase family protein [Pyrinomonadaceae bacterium]|nr:amidohydrolase family protein [Pyrinomonadaceae bacterium]